MTRASALPNSQVYENEPPSASVQNAIDRCNDKRLMVFSLFDVDRGTHVSVERQKKGEVGMMESLTGGHADLTLKNLRHILQGREMFCGNGLKIQRDDSKRRDFEQT